MPRRRSKSDKPRDNKTVAIVGTGLIGASIGMAARAAGFAVVGWDPDPRALRQARARRAVGRAAGSLAEAVAAASIVVLAAPLDAVLRQLPAIFAHAKKNALVIDVAGVKEPVVKKAAALLARGAHVRFVAGHPMAGNEHSGPGAASARLLSDRTFALHAPPQTGSAQAFAAAERFVRKIGAFPLRVAPREHDRAVAAFSALPQLASVALALAARDSGARAASRLAGPGYRDATRLAASAFATWKPPLAANRLNVLRSIRALVKRVRSIETALRRSDWPALERLFSTAALERRRVNPR